MRPITRDDVCNVCVHNLRELNKDERIQKIEIDEYVMRNVVEFDSN